MSAALQATESHRLGPDRETCPVVLVPLQKLRFHPRNIRTNLGDLSSLEASVRAEGILVPLMAERRESGALQLLHGHRRWAVADLVGLRRVPVQIVPAHTDDEAMLVMLAENTGRLVPDAKGLQGAIRSLVDEFGYSPRAISHRLGVSLATVEAWGSGRTTRPSTATSGRIRPPASAAGKTPRKRVPQVGATLVHQLLAQLDSGGMTPDTVIDALRKAIGDWSPQQRPGGQS